MKVPSLRPWGRIFRGRLAVIGIVLSVVLIGAIVLVVVKLTTAHRNAVPASQRPAPADSFAIPGCYNPSVPPVERPVKLNLVGCASVAVALEDMSWSSWGSQGADGAGTAVFRVCEPNCATGYQLTEPVVVHASNPQPPRQDAICRSGLNIFSDLILAFPQSPPPPNAQRLNTLYSGMPAVHYANYPGGKTAQFIGYTFCN